MIQSTPRGRVDRGVNPAVFSYVLPRKISLVQLGGLPIPRCLARIAFAAFTAVLGLLLITPSAGAASTSRPEPPSNCTIIPETFADGNVGTLNTWFFSTTGCATSKKPVRFRVVEGQIPPGTTLVTQGVSSGGITGEPTEAGLFTFTIEVRDATGARDTQEFSIQINPPRPLAITNASDQLSPGTVGEFYCCGNLFADGGVSPYTWTLVAGELPPGLELSASPGRITGTPTTAGTFTFTVRVTDTQGAFAERTFSITIT